jgi:hypothetical protein
MNSSWFDATGTLRFDELAAERDSFQKILQDGVVTSAEFQEQAARVAQLFRTLETKLTPEAKGIATDALCELAVLHALSARAQHASTTDAKEAAL